MVGHMYTKQEVLDYLSVIADPEIPVVSIQEMGMLQDVIISDSGMKLFLHRHIQVVRQ